MLKVDIFYYLAMNNKDVNIQSDLHHCCSNRLYDTFLHAKVRIKSLLPEMEDLRYLQAFFVTRPLFSIIQFYQIFCLVNGVWFRCVLHTTRVETLVNLDRNMMTKVKVWDLSSWLYGYVFSLWFCASAMHTLHLNLKSFR